MATTITVDAGTNVDSEHPSHEGHPEEEVKVSCSVDFDVGDNLADAVDKYGEDIVFERWKRQVRRDLGNAVRTSLNSGKTPVQVESELEDWRPDVTRRTGSSSKDVVEQFEELDENEQEEKLEELMALAQQ